MAASVIRHQTNASAIATASSMEVAAQIIWTSATKHGDSGDLVRNVMSIQLLAGYKFLVLGATLAPQTPSNGRSICSEYWNCNGSVVMAELQGVFFL